MPKKAKQQEQDVQSQVLYPDKSLFINGTTALDIVANDHPIYPVERIEYRTIGGTLIHYHGRLFPAKGFVYPEAMLALNQVKASIKSSLVLLRYKIFWPGILFFTLLPWRLKYKAIENILSFFLRAPHFAIKQHLLRPNFYLDVTNAVRGIVSGSCLSLGLSVDTTQKLTDIIGATIEYDNAYRYRLLDIFSELNRNKLYKNPRKELLRVFKIGQNRENESLSNAYPLIFMAINGFFFLVPKSVKIVFTNLLAYQLNVFRLDEIDWYNVLDRKDYNFRGHTLEYRLKEYRRMHNGQTPQASRIK